MCNLSYGIEEQGIEKGRLDLIKNMFSKHMPAYSVRTAHPFRRNGAPFRFKLSKAQQVD